MAKIEGLFYDPDESFKVQAETVEAELARDVLRDDAALGTLEDVQSFERRNLDPLAADAARILGVGRPSLFGAIKR